MNLFALVSLVASLICISLGTIVYSFNRSRMLNKLFFLVALSGFFYSFTTVMMWQASSEEFAAFWNKMGSIWPFFVVLVVHFALVFTRNGWLKNKLTYAALYLPAVSFWFIEMFTDLINMPPRMEYWGYNDVASGTWLYWVSTVWSASMSLLAFAICLMYFRKASENPRRQQRKYVTIGFGIPIVAFIVTNMVPRSVGVTFPNLGIVSTLFFSAFVGYGILKFELFTFDAAVAAENIVSTMPDSFVLADLSGRIMRVNERLTSFSGYTEDELIGKSILFLAEDNLGPETLKEFTRLKTVRNYEIKLRTKAGESKTVLFSGSIVTSPTGKDVGMTCIIHDITERKQMEERLLRSERLASIGELAGQIGHDLRNPLTGIKTAVYYLGKKGASMSDEERQGILDSMNNAVEDSNRIVSGLVEYSCDLHLDTSRCFPRSLVSNALLKASIPKNIEVINRLPDELELSADADKTESVFGRIIKNAVEAMPEGGTLEINGTQVGSNIEVVFRDTGAGLPEAVKSKLFTPLVTTKAKGMGLSLAICRRIVEAHDGRISAESQTGKGTAITITLPVQPKLEVMADSSFATVET